MRKIATSLIAITAVTAALLAPSAFAAKGGGGDPPPTGDGGTPIASLPFSISSPGFYYVTAELTSDGEGITISASDVTIDLKGFGLTGSNAGNGVSVVAGTGNIEVRNGTVQQFINGITTQGDHPTRVINVRIEDNTGHGIRLGSKSMVKDCRIFNSAVAGIYAGDNSTVTGNTVVDSGTHGLEVGSASIVAGNTISNAGYSGIRTGTGCIVRENVVSGSYFSGIFTNGYATVTGNNVTGNNLSGEVNEGGIRVQSNSLVKQNILFGNMQNNIFIMSHYNSIEENLVTSSTYGINFEVSAQNNFYANNRATANSTNYNPNPSTTDGGGNAAF